VRCFDFTGLRIQFIWVALFAAKVRSGILKQFCRVIQDPGEGAVGKSGAGSNADDEKLVHNQNPEQG
jgi:hypothetical protein